MKRFYICYLLSDTKLYLLACSSLMNTERTVSTPDLPRPGTQCTTTGRILFLCWRWKACISNTNCSNGPGVSGMALPSSNDKD